jgi:septum formation protein
MPDTPTTVNKPRTVPLVLASSSPRRLELLATIGVTPVGVCAPNVDETQLAGESPAELVRRLACLKAGAVGQVGEASLGARSAAAAYSGCEANLKRAVVLAGDTVVVLDGRVLGKPSGQEDFMETLQRLSEREHQVISGVAVRAADGRLDSVVVTTRVHMGHIPSDWALGYWQTGEPADKAGGYAIQGCAGRFVKSIEGSYSNVVGLPLYEVAQMLTSARVLPL